MTSTSELLHKHCHPTLYINSFPQSVLNVSAAGVRQVSNDGNEFEAQARQEGKLGSTLRKLSVECQERVSTVI